MRDFISLPETVQWLISEPIPSSNRFGPVNLDDGSACAFANLRELRLNQTLIHWHDAKALLPFMPTLRWIEMGSNRLKHLDGNSGVPSSSYAGVSAGTKLDTINLDENDLEEWNEIVSSLAKFPSFVPFSK